MTNYGAMNPYTPMRVKSIFAPPDTPDDRTKRFLSQVNPPPRPDFSQPPPEPEQDEAGKYFDQMERVRKNRGPALTAYQAALQEQPTEQNTEVSTGRKIMGTLAGISGGFAGGPRGGVQAANEIIDAPYKTAVRDYGMKMKNLGESAKLEQDDQEGQLKALSAARALGLKYDEFKLKTLEDEKKHAEVAVGHELTRGNNESLAAFRARQAATGETSAATAAAAQKDTARFRTGSLANSARTAATGEKNANTAAANERSEEGYRTSSIDLRKQALDLKTKTGKTVSPSQQAYAVDNALRELATDPRFKTHIIPNKEKGTNEMGEDDGSLIYQEFKRRVKKLAEASIKAGTPFDDALDNDSPVEIGKPRK